VNQCKGCHVHENKFKPIGTKVRLLNIDYNYIDEYKNQLSKWIELGLIDSIPPTSSLPRTVNYEDPNDGTVSERARAWIDINCAHCHQSGGPAENSGLFLTMEETNPKALGIMKTPVAAGRGSGNLLYTIVPGHPEESIFIYRIKSTDPGIMMPEMGRKLVHREGLELVRQWILEMTP
jgi:uncharacterized repeat protein (TIGR03806 family)